MSSAPPADADADSDADDEDDVFDEPSRWRLAAVRSLGLVGDDRIAGVVTGAAYPDALTPIVEHLDEVPGAVCDVGAGLGGASQWIATRRAGAGRGVIAVEPESASVEAASELFPGLAVVQGAATALPIGAGRCGAATLLGVVSLVDDLDVVLAEIARVLAPGGILGVTDLCTAGEDRLAPPGSPNVFRSGELLIATLAAYGIHAVDRWRAPADLATAWDDVSGAVDDEITRRFAAEPAYDAWRDDRRRLHEQITAGTLVVETIVARRAT